MRKRTCASLAAIILALTAAGPVLAASGLELEGRLSDAASASVLHPGTTVTLPAGDGRVSVTTGTLRAIADRSAETATLELAGQGLQPEARYLLVAGTTPLLGFAADGAGRASARFLAGPPRPGWQSLPPVVLERVETFRGTLRVVPTARQALTKNGDGSYFDWTYLCSDDASRQGETSVAEVDGYSYFSASGSGLEPGATVTLRADGIEVGTVTADEWGSVWIDAAAGDWPWPPGPPVPGALFELPEALLPVSEIEAVELLVGGAAVLAGNFASPCMEEPPMPVDAGSIQLCDPDSAWSSGWFDWALFDSGLEVANLYAFGLERGIAVDVVVDGIAIGTGAVLDDGSLWLSFSSAPMQGELPLPPEVLPLSDTQEVALTAGGMILLSGTPNTACAWPGPVEMGATPLCFDDPGDPATGGPSGEVGWAVYGEGVEELWVWASGLEAVTEYGLTIDGTGLGTYLTDDWGSLWLGFSTTGASGQLPLPEDVRPVSGIDQVALDRDGTVVGSGSFSEPCTPPPPPMPVESGSTLLCPQGTAPSSGDVYWSVWDDGYEELYVSAYFLAAGSAYELVIDGFSLGSFTADDWGYLFASFASELQWDGQLLLSPEIRPVSGIDVVELRDAGGGAVAGGSFSSPCTEMPTFSGASTGLCGSDGVMYGMGSWWIASLAGTTVAEGIDILLWPPDSSVSYHAVIDGVEVGELEPRPWEGSLTLSLGTSAPRPVPPELEPVEGIDLVQVLTADGAVAYEGSFSEPCTPEGGDPGPLSGLHDVPASAELR
jgi:hypothetical protein